jgi:hypothetical protein
MNMVVGSLDPAICAGMNEGALDIVKTNALVNGVFHNSVNRNAASEFRLKAAHEFQDQLVVSIGLQQ